MRPRADERAVAQNRNAIGEFEHFLQPMADIDDRHALGLEAADQQEQRRGLLPREIGGRLVEDRGIWRRAARRARSRPAAAGRWSARTAARRPADRSRARRAASAPRGPSRLWARKPTPSLVAEKDIGGDRQMRAEHDFLMDGVDAEVDRFVRGRQRDGLAAPVDFAASCADERR